MRSRLALRQDLTSGIDGVPAKDRRHQPQVGPANVGDRLLADIRHANAGDNRQGRQLSTTGRPNGQGRVNLIEVQRVLVHRQQRKPSIIGLADRAARAMFVNVADREILKSRPATARQRPGATSRAIATMIPLDACLGGLAPPPRLSAWTRLWQLFDCLFQDGRWRTYHSSAEGSCEPDRVRFAIEINMNLDLGAIAAVVKAVWLDPPMIEPGTHLRHRVDQVRDRLCELQQCTASPFPALGISETSHHKPRHRRIP